MDRHHIKGVWLLIAQSINFFTITLIISNYVVVLIALRGFQQFTKFLNRYC